MRSTSMWSGAPASWISSHAIRNGSFSHRHDFSACPRRRGRRVPLPCRQDRARTFKIAIPAARLTARSPCCRSAPVVMRSSSRWGMPDCRLVCSPSRFWIEVDLCRGCDSRPDRYPPRECSTSSDSEVGLHYSIYGVVGNAVSTRSHR
jgi:hypothetical protein